MSFQRLDPEDDEQRERRLARLLQQTDASSSPVALLAAPVSTAVDLTSSSRQTHALPPPTQLLDRLASFLPQMEAANSQLASQAQQDPSSVHVELPEHAHPQNGPYIEMNLGLGVFDVNSNSNADGEARPDQSSSSSSFPLAMADVPVAPALDVNISSDSDPDESDSDSEPDSASSDSDSSGSYSSSDSEDGAQRRTRRIKPLPRRAQDRNRDGEYRPSIVVLNESSTTERDSDTVHEQSRLEGKEAGVAPLP